MSGKNTSDVEVLEKISGIIVDNVHELIQKNVRETVFSQKEQICIRREFQNLRQNGVIKFCEHELGEYISPIFLRPKSDGSIRLILNLKELNSHSDSIHFKMDTINSLLKLIIPNCFMSSIGIKDAYYLVAINPEFKVYFNYMSEGRLSKFVCLPNGFYKGPIKFTKILKPPLATLRRLRHVVSAYIDDLINIGFNFDECAKNILDILLIFDELDIVVHPEKYKLIPSQCITFLGFVIISVDMTVMLTE